MQRKNEIHTYSKNSTSHANTAGNVFKRLTGYDPKEFRSLTCDLTLFTQPYSKNHWKSGALAPAMHTIKLIRDVLSLATGLELALYSLCKRVGDSDEDASESDPHGYNPLYAGLSCNVQAIVLDIFNIIASAVMAIARSIATIIHCVQTSETFGTMQTYLTENFATLFQSSEERIDSTRSGTINDTSSVCTPAAPLMNAGTSAGTSTRASGETEKKDEELKEMTYNYSR